MNVLMIQFTINSTMKLLAHNMIIFDAMPLIFMHVHTSFKSYTISQCNTFQIICLIIVIVYII